MAGFGQNIMWPDIPSGGLWAEYNVAVYSELQGGSGQTGTSALASRSAANRIENPKMRKRVGGDWRVSYCRAINKSWGTLL